MGSAPKEAKGVKSGIALNLRLRHAIGLSGLPIVLLE